MNYSQHTGETLKHRKEVGKGLTKVVADLMGRAVSHDDSKFSFQEAPFFEANIPMLKGLTFGSPEYKAQLEQMKPALDHHYANNNHHPEFFSNGIEDMNLMDITEMLCDWMAAVKRHNDGDIMRSLEINRTRFGISDQLYKILANTVRYLEGQELADAPKRELLPKTQTQIVDNREQPSAQQPAQPAVTVTEQTQTPVQDKPQEVTTAEAPTSFQNEQTPQSISENIGTQSPVTEQSTTPATSTAIRGDLPEPKDLKVDTFYFKISNRKIDREIEITVDPTKDSKFKDIKDMYVEAVRQVTEQLEGLPIFLTDMEGNIFVKNVYGRRFYLIDAIKEEYRPWEIEKAAEKIVPGQGKTFATAP